jgi:hypothetical protein
MEENKNIKGCEVGDNKGGGLEIKGIYEGVLKWRQSFLSRIRRER